MNKKIPKPITLTTEEKTKIKDILNNNQSKSKKIQSELNRCYALLESIDRNDYWLGFLLYQGLYVWIKEGDNYDEYEYSSALDDYNRGADVSSSNYKTFVKNLLKDKMDKEIKDLTNIVYPDKNTVFDSENAKHIRDVHYLHTVNERLNSKSNTQAEDILDMIRNKEKTN